MFHLPLQLQINVILQLEQLPTFLKNIYMSNIILQQSTVVKNVYLIIQCHEQPVNKNTLLFKSNIERMSFVGQVCVHIRGICYSDRSSTVQQNDSDRTGHRQQKNNIQIGNVQNCKDTIYNTDNYVWGLTCANLKWKNKYVWWINNCIIVLCVPCLMSSVHERDCLGKETVPVSGRSGAQSSVIVQR